MQATNNSQLATRDSQTHTRRGVLLVVASAALFGAMPILIKLAYREGLNTPTLLALRFSIAAVGMWLIWAYLHRRGERVALTLGMVLPLVAMGAIGYVGQSFAYFTALTTINASAAGLLLYTYPTLVVLLAWLFFRERLTAQKMLALALASIGALMVLGIFSQLLGIGGVSEGLGSLDSTGVAWALFSAIAYSAYIIAGARFAAGVNPIFASAVIIGAAAVVYVVWGAVSGQLSLALTPLGICWASAIAIVSTVLAITTFVAGLNIIGPSRTAIISTVEPTVTVALSALVLSEIISIEQVLGGALILSAVLVLQARRRSRTADDRRQTADDVS